MPLHIPSAPAPVERSVRTALRSTAARPPHPLHHHRAALRPVMPLPLHLLSPGGDTAGAPRTRLAGWRYLLELNSRAVGAAETMLTADGWAFSHFSEGPFTASTREALGQADSLPADYQPRLLSVPELYMLTLWLHADTGADPQEGSPAAPDLLVPLAPAPPGIPPGLPLEVGRLMDLLSSRRAPAGLTG
ncbi:hypothetical protein PJ985_17635 [Streptomyces sp. ACA25]|uniref:hypothetical protein n=1 Tax=Streptomyces sp. ACA25 TaxID=3022596 RepID=UPI0023076D18|nr:hypothetical protein [Streptomyces sp. ACA25]MDB1089389.1 hypothetical protein [Streptomyces sp. ACA25]